MVAHHTDSEPQPRRPHPRIAILLSLVAQGAGHLYVGRGDLLELAAPPVLS